MHRCCLLWIGLVSFLCVCASLEFPAFCLRRFTSPKVGNIYVCSFLREYSFSSIRLGPHSTSSPFLSVVWERNRPYLFVFSIFSYCCSLTHVYFQATKKYWLYWVKDVESTWYQSTMWTLPGLSHWEAQIQFGFLCPCLHNRTKSPHYCHSNFYKPKCYISF